MTVDYDIKIIGKFVWAKAGRNSNVCPCWVQCMPKELVRGRRSITVPVVSKWLATPDEIT